jgi:hypothetical protein
MVVESLHSGHEANQVAAVAQALHGQHTARHYRMFQMSVASDIRLPVAERPTPVDVTPDVVIVHAGTASDAPAPEGPSTYEVPCYCPQHAGQPVTRVHSGPTQSWVWADKAGVCVIPLDGRRIDVYVDLDDDSESRLAHMLTGTVSHLMAYHRLGVPCLHGSAVVVDSGAVAFIGPKGQGKSTMAAGFLNQGATLLTDDVLPLQTLGTDIYGLPGLPLMKLWDESVEHALELDAMLPTLIPNFDKKAVDLHQRYDVASEPVPMTALYVLQRYDPDVLNRQDVTIQRLRPHEGLMMILSQTPLRKYLPTGEFAPFLPLLSQLVRQAPVRILRYPNGYQHQPAVHDAIRQDVRDHS